MAIDNEKAIAWMTSKVGKVSYSMDHRNGPSSYDCSSSVYYALTSAGASNAGWALNTEYMHDWLIQNGYKLIAENQDWVSKRGDVFIWGKRGQSAGAGGHTGIFVDADNIIHCNYANNGITINNYDQTAAASGWMYSYVYRYEGAITKPSAKLKIDKIDFKAGTFTVRLYDVKSPSGVSAVRFPTWTQDKGQDDIKWYQADKSGNDYVKTVKIADHGNGKGIYSIHAYIDINGKQFGVATATVNMTAGVSGKLAVSDIDKEAGTFKVTVSDVTSNNGIQGVQLPTWTEKDGQDDIKWYKAVKNGDTWELTVKASDHKNEKGKYIVHAYVTMGNGQVCGFGATSVDLSVDKPKEEAPKEGAKIIVATVEGAEVQHITLTAEEFEKLKGGK